MSTLRRGAVSFISVTCVQRNFAIGIRFTSTSSGKHSQAESLLIENDSTEKFPAPSWKSIPFEDASKERSVEIATCGQLFEKWRRENRFWSVPKSDVHFTVKYVDTGYGTSDQSMPVVVSLHGSPGSYNDFAPVTSHLYNQGVRVIAPNFPGGNDVQPKVFRHTPEEKSQYIRDFLKALRVPRVDLLLCHSSALFPGLQLSLHNEGVAVNSLCLLNPTALEIPRLLNPVWLTYSLIRLTEFPLGYKMTCLLGEKLAKKPELKGGSFQEHLLSAVTLLNSDIPKQNIPFQTLLNQNFPILLAYSENDKLIAKKSSHKMAKMMVDEEDIYTYDKEGKLNRPGGLNPFRKVMAFQNGSHFLLRTYPEKICHAVSDFLFQQFNNTVKGK
ncbi:hypothetical protein JTE90_014035 [Oedothorax gibbosus]|uniref:AB hydrolase-1 domain-containing protein n=1 Tax=Oedothorax gibbosus TaxID=931172 RepID=A0AAV6V1D3_9ARAC|nr:hypothetical protein JTE90_014035 [Oedothorax gibbosus]